MNPTEDPLPSPFRGAGWVLAIRWGDRLIGIASTLVLARLLVPSDFGVFALASIVVGLADVLLDLGVHVALLRDPNAGRVEYDSAWTLRLAQSAVAAIVVTAAAYPAAAWFGDPRLAALLPWLALALLIAAFENIGVVDFQKRRRFDRDFAFFFSKRVVGFVVTLAFAFALHSFWALAAGTIAHRLAGVVLSYRMHPFRPRFTLAAARPIWYVSKWLVAANCGAYLEQRIDKLLLGRQAPASTVGAYALADDIAGLPGTELFQPLNRALLPALVADRDDPARLRRAFLLALAIHCIIGFPAGVGLALVAAPLVHLALGPGWDEAIPVLRVLAFAALAVAASAAGRYVLLAAGRTRVLAMLSWFQVVIFLFAIASLGSITAEWIASFRVSAAGIVALLTLAQLPRCISTIEWVDVIQGMARPAAATVVMAGCVAYVGSLLPANTGWETLVALVATGVVTYTATLAMLWLGAGRPTGGEDFLVTNLVRRFARN